MQHTRSCVSRRNVADEIQDPDQLLGEPEGPDVGSLAEGDSLHQIARLFDRYHTSIRGILAETGGIRPGPRRRSRVALTLAEREDISRAVVAGHSIRSIASSLGRAPSTISREISRNGGEERYRASQASRPLIFLALTPGSLRSRASINALRLDSGVSVFKEGSPGLS